MPASSLVGQVHRFLPLLTIVLWASSPLTLPHHQRLTAGAGGAGAAVLPGAGTLPFWRQWRASPHLAGDHHGPAALSPAAVHELSPRPRAGRTSSTTSGRCASSCSPPCCCRVIPESAPPAGRGPGSRRIGAGDGRWQSATATGPSARLPAGLGAAIVWGAYSVLPAARLPPPPWSRPPPACRRALACCRCMDAGKAPAIQPGSPGDWLLIIAGLALGPMGRPSSPGIWRCGTGIRAASARSPTSLPAEHPAAGLAQRRSAHPPICWRGPLSWAAPCSACW